MYADIHAGVQAHAHMYADIHAEVQAHAHMYADIHAGVRAHAHMYADIHAGVQAHTQGSGSIPLIRCICRIRTNAMLASPKKTGQQKMSICHPVYDITISRCDALRAF